MIDERRQAINFVATGMVETLYDLIRELEDYHEIGHVILRLMVHTYELMDWTWLP